MLAGSPPKQLVLLTATPVNNSLWDLYYQLGYFLRNDAAFADVGIPSMRDHFARAMSINPDDLTPEHLFDVLDAVAVRRTRSFVKQYYPNDTVPIDGRDQIIAFPTPRVRKVSYDLDAVLPGFFDRIARALDPDASPGDPEALTLARYAPSMYRLDQSPDSYEIQLAGLLRSGMLKRFESSPHAFAETCHRMANSHGAFLALLDHGRVATGDELADWMSTDSDDIDAADKHADHHTGIQEDAANYDIERLRRDVAADRDLLRSFSDTARMVVPSEDPNLAELVEQLAYIAAEAAETGTSDQDIRNRRKALIFSYYADTVDWIFEHLVETVLTDERLAAYRDRIASLSGNTGTQSKETVIWGFAPKTSDAPEGRDEDLYDIVVTTDVLAEGVNLQQARHIINYDLPWNPMRLVQRHGRIDRIGSHHSEVFIRCVFPDTPPRRAAEPGGATAPQDQAGRSQHRHRRSPSRPARPGPHVHRDPRGDRAHPPRGGRPVRAGRYRPRRLVRRGVPPRTAQGHRAGMARSDRGTALGIRLRHVSRPRCRPRTGLRVLCPGGRPRTSGVPLRRVGARQGR